MIDSIKVTNDNNESITISMKNPVESTGFFIRGIYGLGPPKAEIRITDTFNIDGGLYNSTHIGVRNLVVALGYLTSKEETIEEIRLKSYKYFPLGREVTIEITTDARTSKITGYVESNEINIFSKNQSSVISILCPSVYFSDGEYHQVVFSGVTSLFEFPFSNESTSLSLIEFSGLSLVNEANVPYFGEVETGIEIHIHCVGDVPSDVVIFNGTLNQLMTIDSDLLLALTSSRLVEGDDIYINTLNGRKEITLIRNAVEINILNVLGINSQWLTIRPGDNSMGFVADTGQEFIQFSIIYNNFFLGA